MQSIIKTEKGELIQGDNLEVIKTIKDNSVDSCISDFPYNLSFMGKTWDTQKNFYDWCYQRANVLYPKIKSGGYVLIFGHHKSNHRMKCAFEDVGFKIVEEIDWIYGSGFPKNQDIGKMFDKKVGAEREVVGVGKRHNSASFGEGNGEDNIYGDFKGGVPTITAPSSDLAKQWDGWKTSGLKPAHEPITVFQKPLEGKYLDNIEKYGCGAMNIDACRAPSSQEDKDMINKKSSKNITTNYSDSKDKIYGAYEKDMLMPANELGRFPSNIILDDNMGEILDVQSGITKSGAIKKGQPAGTDWNSGNISHERLGGRRVQPKDIPASEGGASRYFLNINSEDFTPFYYCAKTTKKEKGEGNIHVTVKPKKLIKWLIKLVTPTNGTTIDITSGSGTHGLSCEELNNEEGYNLKWLNIEMMNTEKEPYCDIAKNRIETYNN